MADRELEEELKHVYEVLGRVVMENLDFKGQIRRMEDRMLESDTDIDESRRMSNINVYLANALERIRNGLDMPVDATINSTAAKWISDICNKALKYSGRE